MSCDTTAFITADYKSIIEFLKNSNKYKLLEKDFKLDNTYGRKEYIGHITIQLLQPLEKDFINRRIFTIQDIEYNGHKLFQSMDITYINLGYNEDACNLCKDIALNLGGAVRLNDCGNEEESSYKIINKMNNFELNYISNCNYYYCSYKDWLLLGCPNMEDYIEEHDLPNNPEFFDSKKYRYTQDNKLILK